MTIVYTLTMTGKVSTGDDYTEATCLIGVYRDRNKAFADVARFTHSDVEQVRSAWDYGCVEYVGYGVGKRWIIEEHALIE